MKQCKTATTTATATTTTILDAKQLWALAVLGELKGTEILFLI